MTAVVRIRRGKEWYLGYEGPLPRFAAVAKKDARVCLSEASAKALLGMKGFEGATVEVEKAKK